MSSVPGMDDDLAAAWDELHAANESLGRYIGPPTFERRRLMPWSSLALDPKARARRSATSRGRGRTLSDGGAQRPSRLAELAARF